MSGERVIDCDIVVAGGGLGGVSAATRAAELGLNVVLLEAGKALGGTAMHSGGLIQVRGEATFDEFRKKSPLGDPALLRKVFDGYHPYLSWLQSLGAPGRYGYLEMRGHQHLGYQLGGGLEPHRRTEWFRHMAKYVEKHHGVVLLNTRAVRLTFEDGRVAGLVAESPEGEIEVKAKAVILANGGYQNDLELLTKYFGPAASYFVQRAVEYDRGDGLRMALSAGGQTTSVMSSIWGGLMPASPAKIQWDNYLEPQMMCAYYSEAGIIVNVNGERFFDEGDPDLPSLSAANRAMEQPPGGIWIIMDEKTRRDHTLYEVPRSTLKPSNLRYAKLLPFFRLAKRGKRRVITVDSLALARARGAVIVRAATIEELCRQLGNFGVDADRLSKTIETFNEGIASGTPLDPPRSAMLLPVRTAPFVAIKVAVGISMTHGGVVINENAEVVDAAGSPIPGLYAIPGTAGGIHGSLSSCGIFGKIASEQAYSSVAPKPAQR